MPRGAAEITEYRAAIEARVRALLKEANSTATLDDIKDYVFSQSHTARPRDWLDGMAELFGQACAVDMDQAELTVMQDAWNYFPHRSLNGQSPAERFLELS